MVDFDTELCPGVDFCSTIVDEVVANVGAGSRRGSVVGNPDTASGVDHSFGEVRKPGLGNNVSRKRIADKPGTIRIGFCRGWIIDGESVTVGINPVAEVATVHFWRRNAEEVAGSNHAVAEPLH